MGEAVFAQIGDNVVTHLYILVVALAPDQPAKSPIPSHRFSPFQFLKSRTSPPHN